MNYIKTNVSNIGDPFVLYENGSYYMYATSSEKGFFVYRSADLTNWENLGLCYRKEESWGFMDFWAPEVIKRNGKYVMFFTAKSRALNALRTGVAFADSPQGPFRDTGAPLFDFGYSTIDASPYFEGETGYLYYVRDCSDNVINGTHTSQIYVTRLSGDLTSVQGAGRMIATPDRPWEQRNPEWQWNEGPSVLKQGNRYYLTYSVNCFDSRDYSVGYAVSHSPEGPFQKAEENPILKYIDGEISGPGHNSFFTDKQGNLRAAFHIHTHYEKPSGDRTACICSVAFKDGKLKFI